MNTILELSDKDARDFFLKHKAYCNIDLPHYFDFQPLLDGLNKSIGNKELKDIQAKKTNNFKDVNYKFYSNKDGRFEWRPLQLINPAIYFVIACVFIIIDLTISEILRLEIYPK